MGGRGVGGRGVRREDRWHRRRSLSSPWGCLIERWAVSHETGPDSTLTRLRADPGRSKEARSPETQLFPTPTATPAVLAGEPAPARDAPPAVPSGPGDRGRAESARAGLPRPDVCVPGRGEAACKPLDELGSDGDALSGAEGDGTSIGVGSGPERREAAGPGGVSDVSPAGRASPAAPGGGDGEAASMGAGNSRDGLGDDSAAGAIDGVFPSEPSSMDMAPTEASGEAGRVSAPGFRESPPSSPRSSRRGGSGGGSSAPRVPRDLSRGSSSLALASSSAASGASSLSREAPPSGGTPGRERGGRPSFGASAAWPPLSLPRAADRSPSGSSGGALIDPAVAPRALAGRASRAATGSGACRLERPCAESSSRPEVLG